MANFTPERSDTIRANLINHVAENPQPRRRRALWAAGFVLAGVLAGAGALGGSLRRHGVALHDAGPTIRPTHARLSRRGRRTPRSDTRLADHLAARRTDHTSV